MKLRLRRILPLLLCLALCLALGAAAFADAPDTILGFDADEIPASIDLDHQYALIELRKLFPAELTVTLADGPRRLAVDWTCLEDYDEKLDAFHFVPTLEGYTVADGLTLPEITVNILGELPHPVMPEKPGRERPRGASLWVSDSGTYDAAALPSYYNNYERGVLPPIRNQGEHGTCWAFSTVAAMEADLIHDGNASTGIDLSELHLAYFTYHNYADEKGLNTGDSISGPGGLDYLDVGGDTYYAFKPLSNLIGPVQESLAPYSNADRYAPSKSDGHLSGPAQVVNVYTLNTGNRSSIKNAIMAHGAVATGYNDEDSNYSSTYNSYYYNKEVASNHAITLVGWDDNFSKSNFKSGTPSGNGAWLVRNSWGENKYDHNGYFWLSYYDKSLDLEAYAFDMQPWQYQHCYAYDHSIVSSYYYGNANGYYPAGASVTQSFKVDGGEQIEAIGIEVRDDSNTLSFTVSCGGKRSTAALSYSQPGYYLVRLSSPLQIAQRSTVTVSYTPSRNFFVCVEDSFSYPVCGHTYTTACGSGGFNVSGYETIQEDARIKLFTNDAAVAPPTPDFVLPSGLKTIEREAFAGGSFTCVKLCDKVTTIGARAFADCAKLTNIYIPASVTKIDGTAFDGVVGLTIRGAAGSTAEQFAGEHSIPFIPAA